MRYPGILLILYVLVSMPGPAAIAQQQSCSGTVYDAETKRPLAFVNIVTNEQNIGTATDIDGRFTIVSDEEIEFLRLSYVGYEPRTFIIGDQTRNLTIKLKSLPVQLQEVVIVAGENPAHRIIGNVIRNREQNDPENLKSFAYTSYDKMIFTVDTLDIPEEQLSISDSSEIRLREFLNDKDFFLMETVSERKFLAPDRSHEKVIATRISGFKDPVFLFLSSQLQSTSFYKELIRIADKNYINPISRGSLSRYLFIIEDTTYTAKNDSVFIISFRPRTNTNFDGLKGVMSINNNGWAIQNVIAEPSRNEEGLTIRIQQMYELMDDDHWFPVQLNTDVTFNNIRVNNFAPVGRGKSYIRDVELNPDLIRRQFSQISVEVDPRAGERDELFWYEYRGDSLSDRERNTYQYIDSIGREVNLDRIANTVKSLLSSRLPIGKLDLDLSRIANYNQYEGLYLGIGLLTNRKFSQTIEMGGYWGYGFKDETSKYGGNLGITLDRYREIKLRMRYFNDVTETGGVKFFDDKDNVLSPAAFRRFFIESMDRTTRLEAALSFRALRWATVSIGINSENKLPANDYQFQISGSIPGEAPLSDDFTFTELSAGFRFAYKEKFLQMPDSRISLGTKFPVVWFNYSRGIDNLLDGQFTFNKFDLKVNSSFYFKYFGESKLNIYAGYIDSPIPYTNLYNGRAAFKTISVYAQDAFLTQRMNEFLSDRYLYLFYTHNFGRLLLRTKKFNPEIAFAANFGIGSISHEAMHHNVAYKTMEQIYCESGLMVNRLINFPGFFTFGIGAFYRFGYHHLPVMSDNFTYRLTVLYAF